LVGGVEADDPAEEYYGGSNLQGYRSKESSQWREDIEETEWGKKSQTQQNKKKRERRKEKRSPQ